MSPLDELRLRGATLISEIRSDSGFDSDDVVAFIFDAVEFMGADIVDPEAGEPDRVALLTVWATSMYKRSKSIGITIESSQAGIVLHAALPAGVRIDPRFEGGPAVVTTQTHAAAQLIFWNDSRPNSWLRMLCDNRAEQLLDAAYYSVVDRPPTDA